jgi:hypothetical protein
MFRPWEFDGAHQNMEEDVDVEQVHNAPEENVRVIYTNTLCGYK